MRERAEAAERDRDRAQAELDARDDQTTRAQRTEARTSFLGSAAAGAAAAAPFLFSLGYLLGNCRCDLQPEPDAAPWRAVALHVSPWRDRDGWAARWHITVTRVLAETGGTNLRVRTACRRGDIVDIDLATLPAPPSVNVGERGTSFVDPFVHAPLSAAPERCDVTAYVQMPGAPADRIAPVIGAFCVVVAPERFDVTSGRCVQGDSRF